MEHPRQVLSRSQIFEAVWGYDFGPSSNSLDVYVGYLRRKTEAGGAPRLIHTVRGVGYVLREDEPVTLRRRARRCSPRGRWRWRSARLGGRLRRRAQRAARPDRRRAPRTRRSSASTLAISAAAGGPPPETSALSAARRPRARPRARGGDADLLVQPIARPVGRSPPS